jgi:Carboxypeptidase regulatory-like domain
MERRPITIGSKTFVAKLSASPCLDHEGEKPEPGKLRRREAVSTYRSGILVDFRAANYGLDIKIWPIHLMNSALCRSVVTCALVVSAGALGSLYAAAPAPAKGTVNGTVRDASSGAPLAEMWVAAYDSAGNPAYDSADHRAATYTGSNGAYSLSGLNAGQYRLLAYDPGRAYAMAFANGADSYDTSPQLTVTTSGPPTTNDFQMQLGGHVNGTVTANGPADGVTVAAYNVDSGTRRDFTTTKPDGTYSLVLPPGQYKLAAYDNTGTLGTMFFSNALMWADASPITLSAQQTFDADFVLGAVASLSGTVIDSATGTPIPSILVYVYTAAGSEVRSTMTDWTGSFHLVLSAGSYRLVAADKNGTYGTYATEFRDNASSFDQSAVLTLGPGQTAPDIKFAMQRGGWIRGQITDATSGGNISLIDVAAYNEDGSSRLQTTSNSSGAYLMLLPPGKYRIAAFDDRSIYATQFYQRGPDFVRATPIEATAGAISAGIDFLLLRAGHFMGTVVDAATNFPLRGITVAAYDTADLPVSSSVSNASGQFSVTAAAGTYRLVAWDGTHSYANSFDGGSGTYEGTAPRTIGAGELLSLNFSMRRGVVLAGRVLSAAGTPIRGIEVHTLDVGGSHIGSSVTAEGGWFSFALLPGTYILLARDPSGQYPDSFFNGAASLANASPIVVPSNGASPTVTLVLTQTISRRRSVPH